MTLQGSCKADRAEVVERDRFATPNPLKSHGERNLLSPFSNTWCHNAKVVHAFEANTPFEKLPGTQITYRSKISIAPAAPSVPHFPRFRALALFGRRPQERVDSVVIPASKNLHKSGTGMPIRSTRRQATANSLEPRSQSVVTASHHVVLARVFIIRVCPIRVN